MSGPSPQYLSRSAAAEAAAAGDQGAQTVHLLDQIRDRIRELEALHLQLADRVLGPVTFGRYTRQRTPDESDLLAELRLAAAAVSAACGIDVDVREARVTLNGVPQPHQFDVFIDGQIDYGPLRFLDVLDHLAQIRSLRAPSANAAVHPSRPDEAAR